MALDLFAGCVGGAASVFVGHPLDTVKVRIQTQCPDNPKYRGTFHCLSSIARQESISGLYKGIASPMYGSAAVNAITFGVYGILKPVVHGPLCNDALWAHFIAGSLAGSVQSIVTAPMELIKTRMQLDESTKGAAKGPSAWKVLKNIYLNEGGWRKGVFKGWGITLGREIPGFGFYFSTYEVLTRGGREITTPEMLMAGGMAGVVSWITCFPMDVVKTRIQSDTQGKYTGTVDCYRKTLASEGYRAFFRGLNSSVIRAFPSNAATFTAVTWIMRLAEQHENSVGDKRNSLDILLEQWGAVSGKVVESLQLKTPHYSFLPLGNSPAEYNNVFQQHHSFFHSSVFQFTKTTVLDLVTELKRGNGPQHSTPLEATEEPALISNVSFGQNNVSSYSNEPVEERKSGNQLFGVSSAVTTGGEESSLIFIDSASNSSSSTASFPGTPTPTKNAEIPVKAQGNSHGTGSLPADLSILAEILDLPLIVLENSLDGKPITLFNIILTWLMQKTPLSLCRCLSAFDQCVCLAR